MIQHKYSIPSRITAVLLMILLLVPALAIAQERPVVDIVVTGNERISTDAITAVIGIKPGTPYSEAAVKTAREAILNMGYFSAVTVGVENIDSGVRLVFNVVENPVVTEINVTGNTVIPTEKLRSLMRTQIGNVLNTNTLLQQDIPAIERYYSEQGYIATVTENVGINPQTGVVTIPILEVTVEEIRITGNTKTKTYVVTREMELKPGDVFNRNVLFADLRRIYDLQIFDTTAVEPYKLEAGSQLGKVIITIPLKERKTGEVSVGVGYSSKQKLVGKAQLSESNFRGRAQTVNLSWEQSGDRGSSYELGFFEPWLDTKHTSLGVSLYNKLVFRFANDITGSGGDVSDYDERHIGGSATLSRPFGRVSRGFVTLRSETVDTNLDSSSSTLLANGSVTSGTLRYTISTRDSELEPFRGSYISYSTEVGRTDATEQIFGNDKLFAKYNVDFRRYFSKGGARTELNERRPVLATRIMAGSLSGDVPFFEQYFVGGAETLRGYREDRFWGKNMFLASVEPRFPIAPSLTGVVFVDVGDAWGASSIFQDPNNSTTQTDPDLVALLDDLPQHEGFSPKVGYGVGIRVITPIGPLRLDYGFGSEGSRAHFSIGHAF
ncbi:MAG: BamA/OMP85 family outer membrane protein [Armatimonadota bacterium]